MQLADSRNFPSKEHIWMALHNVDYKLILIPVTFIFLRIWTCIIAATFVYSRILIVNIHNQTFVRALIYLSAIGDSGQGAANGLIFLLFTKKVRDKFKCCCPKRKDALANNKSHVGYASFFTPPLRSPSPASPVYIPSINK
jgi:hypothetical protein